MASCKNCINYDVCERFERFNGCICKMFKDKHSFVKLPCQFQDTVFQLCERKGKNKIIERTVESINFYKDGMSLHCGTTLILFQSNFGKTVFFTREEAEQALKNNESEKNDIIKDA